jgi:hypothetical protein
VSSTGAVDNTRQADTPLEKKKRKNGKYDNGEKNNVSHAIAFRCCRFVFAQMP